MNETLKAIALEGIRAEDLFDAVDGYKGKGYGLTTENDLGKTAWAALFYIKIPKLIPVIFYLH